MPSANRLRERMRRSKTGWGFDDLDLLYKGHDFVRREGGKHVIYTHSKYPELRATVSRSSSLDAGYIRSALQLLDQLDVLQRSASGESQK